MDTHNTLTKEDEIELLIFDKERIEKRLIELGVSLAEPRAACSAHSPRPMTGSGLTASPADAPTHEPLELQGTETIDAWDTLPDGDQKRVLVALATKLQTKDLSTLRRIVDLANPKIARGIQYDKTYTRIANESLDVLRVMLNAYLK